MVKNNIIITVACAGFILAGAEFFFRGAEQTRGGAENLIIPREKHFMIDHSAIPN